MTFSSYGRGSTDMKDGDAILVANFIRLKKERFTPDRDLIIALTADEERLLQWHRLAGTRALRLDRRGVLHQP